MAVVPVLIEGIQYLSLSMDKKRPSAIRDYQKAPRTVKSQIIGVQTLTDKRYSFHSGAAGIWNIQRQGTVMRQYYKLNSVTAVRSSGIIL